MDKYLSLGSDALLNDFSGSEGCSHVPIEGAVSWVHGAVPRGAVGGAQLGVVVTGQRVPTGVVAQVLKKKMDGSIRHGWKAIEYERSKYLWNIIVSWEPEGH